MINSLVWYVDLDFWIQLLIIIDLNGNTGLKQASRVSLANEHAQPKFQPQSWGHDAQQSIVSILPCRLLRVHADDQDKKTTCLFWTLLFAIAFITGIIANFASLSYLMQSQPSMSRIVSPARYHKHLFLLAKTQQASRERKSPARLVSRSLQR